MIEFLPPRDDAFGERDVADFVGFDGLDDAEWDDEPPRSRWLTALAVLGVTGLLAGGVLAAAPWDDTSATPAPSTTVPTSSTERPRPTTSVRPTEPTLPAGTPTSPAGWVPVESSGYQVVWAMSNGDEPVFDMYASGGSSLALYVGDGEVGRTTGRWLAVNAFPPEMTYQPLRRGAVPTVAGDRRALVSTASDGVVNVDVEVIDGDSEVRLSVTGHGVGLDVLLAVAAADGLPTTGNARMLDLTALEVDGGPLDGLRRVPTDGIGIWPFNEDIDPAMAWTDVVSSDGRRWASVRLSRPDATRDVISSLLLTPPLPPDQVTDEVQVRLDELARRGMRVTLQRSIQSAVVYLRAGLPDGTRLTVTMDGSVLDALGVLADLRPADPDDWVELLVDSQNGRLVYPQSTAMPTFTSFGSGRNWSAEVSDGRFNLGAEDTGAYERFEFAQGPSLVEYRTFDRLFLRATTTFPSEARSITVVQEGAPAGRDLQVEKLAEVGTTGVLGAVVQLDPALPYRVVWTDADGATVDGPADASVSRAVP